MVSFLLAMALLTWLVTTQSGLIWVYQQAENHLPSGLSTSTIEGRLIGPVSISDLDYRFEQGFLKADQVTLDWSPLTLLGGSVDIQGFNVKALEIQLPPGEQTARTVSLPNIRLPWRVTLDQAVVENLTLNRGSEQYRVPKITLKGSALTGKVTVETLAIEGENFGLKLSGTLRPEKDYRHDLSVAWQASLPSAATIQGKGRVTGNLKSTRVTQVSTGALESSVTASLTNLLDELTWQASADIGAFDARQLNSGWPAVTGSLQLESTGDLKSAGLSGSVEGHYPALGPFDAGFQLRRLDNAQIQIDQLTLQAPDRQTEINGAGQWIPGANGGGLRLTLDWKNLRWPLAQTPWFDSAYGTGSIEGNLDRYKVELTTDRPWPQVPPSTWSARAEGDRKGLRMQSLKVSALEGEATAAGEVNWSPALNWRADIIASNVNPGALWPRWPGRLNGTFSSVGKSDAGRLSVETTIKQLNGQLRQYPVALESRFTWADYAVDVAKLDLELGSARVSAQGRLGKTAKLKWQISAADMGALWPRARGQLEAQGWLTGSLDKPLIKAKLQGADLALDDYQIGSVEGHLSVDLYEWQKSEIELAARALSVKGHRWPTLAINGNAQRLVVDLVAERGTAQLELVGEATGNGWSGEIKRADIQSAKFANWGLKTPGRLSFDRDQITTDNLCWQSGEESRVCTTLVKKDTSWRSEFAVNRLPLNLLKVFYPADLTVEGELDGSAKLHLDYPILLGQASLQLMPGQVHYPLLEGERDHWPYRGGKVNIDLSEKGVTTDAEFVMGSGDRLHFTGDLPGAQLLALDYSQQPIRAQARLIASDLGLIEALLPEVQELKGELAVDLKSTGTLARPNIQGDARFVNGALRVPRLGLTIDQISLVSENSNDETVNFQLKARSGEGELVVDGETTLDGKRGWPTRLRINGDDFEVSRIPESQIRVSPDLEVSLQRGKVDITGGVHIPFARLEPIDISRGARVSADAVVISDDPATADKWTVTSRVRLSLGERVSFYGFGFEGRFGGSVLLEEQPGQATRATGEINIPEGRYRAYGQRLDVEQGRLVFSGGPPGNPGLDVRAVRHVDKVTVGIKLRGNLNNPQLELFSIPAMGQTNTLAYLLLGRPLDSASSEDGNTMVQAALALGLSGGDSIARAIGSRFGMDEMRVESSDSGDQASLMMGRYLSPRLYVGYGVGLVKPVNTFNVRYQINEDWQLKGESGEYPGVDLLYTIDR